MQFDSAQIGVTDVDHATRDYALVLGCEPIATSDGRRRFQLERGAIEIETGEPGVHSLRFVPGNGSAAAWPTARESFNGLAVRIGLPAPVSSTSRPNTVHAIDHVVINTPDLDRAIGLWRDRLGIRLALDREFPRRGLRMCFFRSAGITLEFVSSLPPPPDRSGPDIFYGLAYQVRDLSGCRTRLAQAGVDVSEMRAGHKPGTSVATVRSHIAGVPTLLISAASPR